MKVALIRPNYHSHLITPPLGLGYLASFLKNSGHETQIIDGLNLSLSNEEIARRVSSADLIGVHCLSSFYLEAKDLVGKLKQENLPVVIGGPHASALPVETIEETKADYVIIGEGEQTFLELADALENRSSTDEIKGLLIRGSVFKKREFIGDLDSIPFPDWWQIDPRKYRRAPHGAVVKRLPVAPVITTRGCPYACKFCASPYLWSKTVRFRSPENVVDEIEYLTKELGVREIHFEDDNLNLKSEHIKSICDLILKRNLKITWATPNGVRVNGLTRDLTRLMKKSGCYLLAFGIESGNQSILDSIDKKTDLATIERAVRVANSEGILTQGFFIFGLPGETEGTIRETINFAKRLPLDRAQFLLLDVLPGSGLWDELKGAHIADWHKRSYQEVKWVPPTISSEILEKSPARAFRNFFFRPRQLFNLVKYIKPCQVTFIIKRLIDFRILPPG
jgi:anaerobic magnesium-protoporphyrin IX monomethyl ester cyclase